MSQVAIELWELVGPYWKLPIRVVWLAGLAEIKVGGGIRLLRKQIEAAEQLLGGFCTRQMNRFYASREQLEKVAMLSIHTDPENVVEWLPLQKPNEPEELSTDDFINGYCKSVFAVVPDPLLAETIWTSFCKWMLHWLLNEERTLNLQFAKVNAFALRRDWALQCSILEHEWRRQRKSRPLPESLDSLIGRVGDFLVSYKVSAFEKHHGVFRHTLDIAPSRYFDETARKLERIRKSKTSPKQYLADVRQKMLRQLPAAIEAYVDFTEQTSYPLGPIPESYEDGGKEQLRAPHPSSLRVPKAWSNPRFTLSWLAKSLAESRKKKADVLPNEMPVLRPAESDMRNGRPSHE